MIDTLNAYCLEFVVEFVRSVANNNVQQKSTTSDGIFDSLPLPPNLIVTLKRRLRAKLEWLKKHDPVLKGASRFKRYIVWLDDSTIDDWSTAVQLIQLNNALTCSSKFELASVYCMCEQAMFHWNSLTREEQSHYLAEISVHYAPVVKFWIGVCESQPYLADMYLVRAFYWAAEHNYIEALSYFWQTIERERSDAVSFRAVRAFQLGAYHGHMQILTFFWSRTNKEQQRQMIQGVLKFTEGSLRVMESACKFGHLDILQFLYNEATHELRQVMLRACDCNAFRLAVDENQSEIVRFFLEKATRAKLCGVLLEADDFSSFRKITLNGRLPMLELFWEFADQEERKALMTAPFYLRRDLREAVRRGYTNVAKFLWDHSSADLKEILLSNCFAPCLSEDSFQSFLGALDGPFKLIDDDDV